MQTKSLIGERDKERHSKEMQMSATGQRMADGNQTTEGGKKMNGGTKKGMMVAIGIDTMTIGMPETATATGDRTNNKVRLGIHRLGVT